MELTVAQHKMLSQLTQKPKLPGWLGFFLWGRSFRLPQHYARPAGRLLRQLQDMGPAAWSHDPSGWVITQAGEAALGNDSGG